MPRKLLAYVRQNTIALLALFVALGGTSYAAISLPRNSVGARQIRNHTITPGKLNAAGTGGYVLDWAQIDHVGHVLSVTTQTRDHTQLELDSRQPVHRGLGQLAPPDR